MYKVEGRDLRGCRSVFERCGIPSARCAVLLWVLFRCSAVECAANALAAVWRTVCKHTSVSRSRRCVPNFLLRPLEIPLHLLGGLHTVREVCSRLREACTSLCLQGEQLAVLCVQLAGPAITVSAGGSSLSRFIGHSHLRLLYQILIQRYRVVGLRQAIVHVVEKINASGPGRRAVIFAAGIVARC